MVLHNTMGTWVSQPQPTEAPFLGCSISYFEIQFQPFISPGVFFFFFCRLIVFKDNFSFFTFGISLKELLLLQTLAEEILQKKRSKKEKEIKARWAQDKSFSKIKVDVFPQTPFSLLSCVSLNV